MMMRKHSWNGNYGQEERRNALSVSPKCPGFTGLGVSKHRWSPTNPGGRFRGLLHLYIAAVGIMIRPWFVQDKCSATIYSTGFIRSGKIPRICCGIVW
jgi:hypothetical protein